MNHWLLRLRRFLFCDLWPIHRVDTVQVVGPTGKKPVDVCRVCRRSFEVGE